jgi:hypothetical protein
VAKRTVPRKPRTVRRGGGAPAPEVLEPVDLGTEEELRAQVLPQAPPPPPEVEEAEYRDVGFLRKAWMDAWRTLREAARWQLLGATPYGYAPALMFGLLGLVGSWNGRVLNLVLPEMVRDLDFNAITLVNALNIVGFFFIFITIGVAYVLDRIRRVPFVGLGAIAAGIGSLFTPHSRRVATVALSTIANDTGGLAASIPQFALLNDYYPPETRGRANAFAGTLVRFGTLCAPWMVGLMAINWGWRSPFYVTASVLIAVGVLILLVLREPVRGYMERRALGMAEEDAIKPEPPMSFGQAWRTIWGIRTIRRLFIGSIADGVGSSTGSTYSSGANSSPLRASSRWSAGSSVVVSSTH